MRDGMTVGTTTPQEVDAHQLAEMMIGSELPSPETRESTVRTRSARMSTTSACSPRTGRKCSRASLQGAQRGDRWRCRRGGERTGAAGGRPDLGLAPGADRVRSMLAGIPSATCRTRSARAAGIGLIPEDRQRQGLLLSSPLWENAALGHQYQEPYANGIWIDKKASRQQTEEIVAPLRGPRRRTSMSLRRHSRAAISRSWWWAGRSWPIPRC